MKESKKHPAPEAAADPSKEKREEKEPQPPTPEAAAADAEASGGKQGDAKKPEAAAAPEPTELEKAQRALAELGEKYIYLQAEYQNYRKRVAKELAGVRSMTVADTLHPFLNVCDFLNMADVAATTSDNIESIRQGLKMILGEFNKAFDELGVKSFSAAGEKFDPALHDAVASENSDTVPEGVVIRQWSCGFKLGETLLRPARVVVSSGPVKAAEKEKAEDPAEAPAETPADGGAAKEE